MLIVCNMPDDILKQPLIKTITDYVATTVIRQKATKGPLKRP